MMAESEFNAEVAGAVKKEPFEEVPLTDNADSAPFTSDLLPTLNDVSEVRYKSLNPIHESGLKNISRASSGNPTLKEAMKSTHSWRPRSVSHLN